MLTAILLFISSVALIILCAAIVRIYQKRTNAQCDVTKADKTEKTVIVTGGTAGIGLELAKYLAGIGGKVIIAGRDEEKGVKSRDRIVDATRAVKVVYKHLDFSTLASVHSFANEILKTEQRLDILVNNAGVLIPPDVKTVDGMNFVMQVNYYGHFLLTLLLLPLMKKTGTEGEPCRIINMSSVLHRFGSTDIENLNRVGYWYRWRIYCNSKLCMAMFTTALSKRLEGSHVVVNSVDPGAVGTRTYDTCGSIGFIITVFFRLFFKTPKEGAQTALYLALDEEGGQVNGKFFKNCKVCRAVRSVYDEALCQKLWEETARLVHSND